MYCTQHKTTKKIKFEEIAKSLTVSQNKRTGRWGARDAEGKVVIPFAYDEVTRFGPNFRCRICDRETHFYITLDKEEDSKWVNIYRRWHCRPGGEYADEPVDYITTSDGEDAPAAYVRRYQRGKYGFFTSDGREIIPPLYDEVDVWTDCEVVQVRKGLDYSYFDFSGRPILTSVPCPPTEPFDAPYYLYEQQNDVALEVMGFVDSVFDNQCAVCYGRPTRLDRIPVKEVEPLLRRPDDVVPFADHAFWEFNSIFGYIYRGYVVEGDTLEDCFAQLRQMRCFSSSWHFIDKVTVNPVDNRLSAETFKDDMAGIIRPHKMARHLRNGETEEEFYARELERYRKYWPEENDTLESVRESYFNIERDCRVALGTDAAVPCGRIRLFHIEYHFEVCWYPELDTIEKAVDKWGYAYCFGEADEPENKEEADGGNSGPHISISLG